jgi:lipoprotein-releasing system ATP-binding protein
MNFEVRRGERLALVGQSGSGKSTLLYLLGGLDSPSSGQIFFGANDIASFSEPGMAAYRNSNIGFVWQNHSLLPEFTAVENVMMPLLIRGVESSKAVAAAQVGLEEVGLKDRAMHRVGEMSGGEQQRVAIARALIGNPSILLADEPTGNLDFRTGDMIVALLARLHSDRSLTSVFVTHNLEFARRCDRVLEIARGAVAPWIPERSQSSPHEAGSNSYGGSYV